MVIATLFAAFVWFRCHHVMRMHSKAMELARAHNEKLIINNWPEYEAQRLAIPLADNFFQHVADLRKWTAADFYPEVRGLK